MKDFNMHNLEINGLRIKVSKNYGDNIDNGGLMITIEGILISEQSYKLKEYFDELHNKIVKNEIKYIVIDFFNLEMLDRDGFVEITNWFINANTLDIEEKYKITILYDNEKKWQSNVFTMMSNLFPQLLSIEPL